MKHVRMVLVMASALLVMSPPFVWSQVGDSTHGHVDDPTHKLDHLEDEQVEVLETVHVHGLRLNKDQQLGPVPNYTPWPTMPPELQGQSTSAQTMDVRSPNERGRSH